MLRQLTVRGARVWQRLPVLNCSRTCAAEGRLFVWGQGSRGRLGTSTNTDQPVPVELCCRTASGASPGVAVLRFHSVACGYYHTAAVDARGRLLVWGGGEHGRLGTGDVSDRPVPTVVPLSPARTSRSPGVRVAAVACGAFHTAALCDAQHVWTWGRGTSGALGHGDVASCAQPKRVAALVEAGVRAIAVECGDSFTAALTSDGALYTWCVAPAGGVACCCGQS